MALAKGWMKKDAFYGYKMEQDETDPVFLTYDELQTIMNKDFTIPRLALVRDIFILPHSPVWHLPMCPHSEKKIWYRITMEIGGSGKEESN